MELNNKEVLAVLALSAKNIPPLPPLPSIQIFRSPSRRIQTSFVDPTLYDGEYVVLVPVIIDEQQYTTKER
ncbi:hypothetical protein P8452_76216 [Trifolium repens]|nr:hypothetical protein P8452_76216 [Trifolium repens]